MKGYQIANLETLIESIGEDAARATFADFSCPMNSDIEDFLLHKAETFSKQNLAKTHLVFASFRSSVVLVGYFALAYKTFNIRSGGTLGSSMRKRLKKFARVIPETGNYELSAPLIAQLGKNYTNDYGKLITGDELLQIACDKISNLHTLVGGKSAFVECENKAALIAFYTRNGFNEFDRRPVDRAERSQAGQEYVQLIKYF